MMEERREAKDRAIKEKTEALKEKDPKVIAPFVKYFFHLMKHWPWFNQQIHQYEPPTVMC